MPFTWKSKGKTRQKVPADIMRNAVKEVLENGKSVNAAAKRFSVDRKTLGRYVKKVTDNEGTNFTANHVSSLIFPNEEEILLERYLIHSRKLNYGLSTTSARKFAYQFAIMNDRKIPENWTNSQSASKDWFRGFMKRHPTLSLRTPQATSLSRGTAFNKTTVTEFFNNIKAVFNKHAYGPEAILNLDETGVTTVQKPGKVIAQKGEKQVSRATSAERGTLVTMCSAVSAIGMAIPPFFIFPRKRLSPRMTDGAPSGSDVAAHDSGWMTGENFEKYWLHFIKYAKSSPTSPVVVILDNHESHITPKGLQICKQNGITLVTLPPHTSHKLQPLNRSVFGPFKKYYNSAADDFMVTHPAEPITIYDIPALVAKAFPKAFNPVNIQKGFKCTGIWPLNCDIFDESDFLSSYVTDRPDPTIVENVANSDLSIPKSSSSATRTAPPEDRTSSPTHSGPSHSRTSATREALSVVTPEQIRPFPKAGARKTRNSRKRVVSRVLTDSPVKKSIEEKYEARQAKKNKTIEIKKERVETAKKGAKTNTGGTENRQGKKIK